MQTPTENTTAEQSVMDVLEGLCAQSSLEWERVENLISSHLKGTHVDYPTSFIWVPDEEILHLNVGFEIKVPDSKRHSVAAFLAEMTKRIWMGHVCMWKHEEVILYRNAITLPEGMTITARQCEEMLRHASYTLECCYTGVHCIVWGGQSAEQAVKLACFEIEGNA